MDNSSQLRFKVKKMKLKLTRFKLVSLFSLTFLLMVQMVYAFGVTSPYWDTKPLELEPGQSADLQLLLQNMVGGKEMVLQASISEGADFASLVDTNLEYSLPFGAQDVPVNLKVMVPTDAVRGSKHQIKVSFKQLLAQDSAETVQLGAGVGASFPVIVAPLPLLEKESSFSPSTVVVMAVALTAIGVGGYFIKRRYDL